MKLCFLTAVLVLLCAATSAAPSEVEIYGGYSLGVVKGPESLKFNIVLPGSTASGQQSATVYADRTALVQRGSISKCDTTELGSAPFASTLVRIWLRPDEAATIFAALSEWQRAASPNRVLSFARAGRLVHGHDPMLAAVSESRLLLHIGAKEEAKTVLEAICGDA